MPPPCILGYQMETITSRKNKVLEHIRLLAKERNYRRETGFYLCDGEKLLGEAMRFGARIETLLFSGDFKWKLPEDVRVYRVSEEILNYVSPLQNTRGPLFSVAMSLGGADEFVNAVILENVQDPGNVGTIIRTANALGIGAVILTGACADPHNPKTVRSAMGALFRQRVLEMSLADVFRFCESSELPIYGAAACGDASDIRNFQIKNAAVAIGSEGSGLSDELLSNCAGRVKIPMGQESESLNAAVAASIIMWEMARNG